MIKGIPKNDNQDLQEYIKLKKQKKLIQNLEPFIDKRAIEQNLQDLQQQEKEIKENPKLEMGKNAQFSGSMRGI